MGALALSGESSSLEQLVLPKVGLAGHVALVVVVDEHLSMWGGHDEREEVARATNPPRATVAAGSTI
jgi:hypothetical protein